MVSNPLSERTIFSPVLSNRIDAAPASASTSGLRGLPSATQKPLRDFTGRTRLWVEVGQPEERPVLKACQQSDAVVVYAFSHAAEVWWRGIESKLARLDKLTVWRIPADASRQLAALAERGMQLQATVQEGQLWMASAKGSVMVEPQCWKPLSNE